MNEPTDNPSPVGKTGFSRTLLRWLGGALGPFLALALVIFFFGAINAATSENPTFLDASNLRTIVIQTSLIAVAALGMTVVIIAGGIDLSAGTALALSATVMAWSLKQDFVMPALYGEKSIDVYERYEELDSQRNDVERSIAREEKRAEEEGNEPDVEKIAGFRSELEAILPDLRTDETRLDRAKFWASILAVLLTLGTGCACGFVNGAIISWLKVVPFIATLGTMTFYLGLAKMLADETTIRPHSRSQVAPWLGQLRSIRDDASILGFPAGVWLAVLLAIALAAVLRYTVFSRYVYALGSNESTARLCGINVNRVKILVYTLAGFFVGVAGLYQFSKLSVGNPGSGVGLELQIIAAVVIGGGSLSGGRGSVVGTFTGAMIIFVIGNGCTQLGLSNPVQEIILGVIIVAAVFVDQVRQRKLAA